MMGQNKAGRQSDIFAHSKGDEGSVIVKGTVDKIVFQNTENGYAVLRMELPENRGKVVTVVGTFPSISEGESLEVKGKWGYHPTYGKQFTAESYHTVYPVSIEGIIKFLGSGIIKGVGPATAKRIVDMFKEKTLEVIENCPQDLAKVAGIGDKKIEIIKKGWVEQKRIKDLMLFLANHNISTSLAIKIYKQYGDRSISILQHNPYQLVYDIYGVGFITADKIALDLGLSADSPSRAQAGIHFILHDGTEDGHSYYPKQELIQRALEILKVSEEQINKALEDLLLAKRIIIENDHVYLYGLHFAETDVARRLLSLMGESKSGVDAEEVDQDIVHLEHQMGIEFAEQQREAIRKALSHHILVITGGPGTGKTTIVRAILKLFLLHKMRVALAAPTGRAAKKLEETAGFEARTIHRLLEFNPRTLRFAHDQERPLEVDAVIVDEVSMIDLFLFHNLAKSIAAHTRIVLVGDIDQLPAVGPGNVLKDIINSGTLEVVRLNQIFRQAKDSDIITNAHRINQGEFPHFSNAREDNFFFVREDKPEKAADAIRDLCLKRIPSTYNFDSMEDIQVITPMHKGDAGATNLNVVLQQALNPKGMELQKGGKILRIGDKVMQIRNNYQKEVYNGDIGRIMSIDLENQELYVGYGGKKVPYDFSELDEIILAYAITVHKSQGSEYKAVVMPLLTQHFVMLQRNLIYTAVTRAKELFIMVGSKKALAIAIKNDKVAARYTSLASRLQNPGSLP